MHEVFKVAFAHWGVNLPNVLSKFSMTKTEELKLCVNSKYYKNFCFKWLPVNMVGFLLTSAIFFLVDENRIVLLLKQPHILSYQNTLIPIEIFSRYYANNVIFLSFNWFTYVISQMHTKIVQNVSRFHRSFH